MDAHLAEMYLLLCNPLGRERVASDSLFYKFYNLIKNKENINFIKK